MLRLALIFGGRSAEHEISLASARFVSSMLDRDEYDVIPVGITPAGRWVVPADFDAATTEGLDAVASQAAHLVADPTRPGLELADGSFHALDFAFPIMHGTFAEDGTIQGLLEMAGLAYAGSGVLGSSVGMDKELMKAVFASAGLPQMDYVVLRDDEATGPDAVAAVEARLEYPVFVKPANLGSSVGMTKAHDRAELGPALELAAVYDRKTIVEKACDGPGARVQPARQRGRQRVRARRGHPGQRVLRLRGQVHRGHDGLQDPRRCAASTICGGCRSWRWRPSRPSTPAASRAATSSSRPRPTA